jgi:hypothetical protein
VTDKERKRLFQRARREVLRRRTAIQRDTAAEIVRLLNLARDRIRETLAAQPTDYERWYLPQLQRQIEDRLAEFERAASRAAAAGHEAAAAAGRELIEAPLRSAGVLVQAAAPGVDARQLEAMRNFLTDRIKGLTGAALDRINTELGLVILGVQAPGEAVAKVAAILGKDARARASTIVRTEIGRAFSSAAHERMKASAQHLPGLKRLWRRSGKLRSRPEHDAIDGQVRGVGEPFEVVDARTGEVVHLMYPRDPAAPPGQTINCGCEALPFMESWGLSPGPTPFTEQELTPAELARNPVKAAFTARRRGI